MKNEHGILPNETLLQEYFSKNLKFLRLSRKLSQCLLAEKLCITQKTLSQYEQGDCMPPVFIIIGISNYFHIPLQELLFEQLFRKERKD